MKINEEIIDDIRESASISQVISHYIPINKKGKNYTAVCPFHDDHDPSLTISEDKKIYKCFVCGNGGNVFRFVQNYKKISYPEAIKEVSEIIGKPIDIEIEKRPKQISKYQEQYDLLSAATNYATYLLLATDKGKEALAYLEKRNIDEEIINYFNIGYNPNDNYLYRYLSSQGFKDDNMIKTNVVRLSNYGLTDVFYERILFPIHNESGNVIGFTARDFKNLSDSKYINTSETNIFIKGNILYNYHRAIDYIKQNASLIICEGVMDVIAYYKAGIKNVIATLGTACSNNQIKLLQNLSKTIILSFDGDNAGKKANMKLGELLLSRGFNVKVIDNNTKLDPDEIINKYGKNALRDLASKQLDYLDYALNYYKDFYNLNNYSERKEMAQKMWSLIDLLSDTYDKDNYNNEVYEITKLRKIESNNNRLIKNVYNNKVVDRIALDGLSKAEYIILMMMSKSLSATKIFQKELGCLINENNQKLAMIIIDDYRKTNSCHLAKIYDEVEDENIKNLITDLADIDDISYDFDEKILLGAIARVKRQIKEEKLMNLKKKINDNEILDKNELSKYLEEYRNLLRDLGGKYEKS